MEPEFRKRINEKEQRRRYLARKRKTRLLLIGAVSAIILTLIIVFTVKTVNRIKAANNAEPEASGETFTYWNTVFTADERKPKNTLNEALFVEAGDMIDYIGMANTMQGIDVSSHNGDIDWEKAASDGIEFVMIRLGNRGATEGDLYEDEKFEEYYDGAKAAGLKVGAYFFSQAMSKSEAKAEAKLAIKILDGRALDMPLAYDWEFYEPEEESARTDEATKELLTEVTEEFCSYVEKNGYDAMIYTNLYQAYMLLDIGRLATYDLWFAGYSENPSLYYEFSIWQYTSSGTVEGIEGNVDRDLWFEIN